MELNNPWIAVFAGLLCGILSGFGIGGGSLLMVWMTGILAIDQRVAQGINLLYFLPAAVTALFFHFKNNIICKSAIFPAALCGCLTAAASSFLAASVSVQSLRRYFGVFLILVGFTELLKKNGHRTQ